MGRLTFKNQDGTWGIKGYDIKKVPTELYGAICKLMDYEETQLSPNQIKEMDNMYQDKCREVERYKKLSLSVEEMAKVIVILEEFKKLKKGEKIKVDEKQTRMELETGNEKESYSRMFVYFRKLLIESCMEEGREEDV